MPTPSHFHCFFTSCICVGFRGIYRAAVLCKVVKLQSCRQELVLEKLARGTFPAIQTRMQVSSAVTFENTGSEARWWLAAAALAAAVNPLVCAGNLTIDASVICQESGSGVADSSDGSATFSKRRSCATLLFPSGAAPRFHRWMNKSLQASLLGLNTGVFPHKWVVLSQHLTGFWTDLFSSHKPQQPH